MRRLSAGCLVLLLAAACEEKKPPPPSAALAPSASTAGGVASAVESAAPAPTPSASGEPSAIAVQHVLVAYKGAANAPKSVTRSKADAKKRADEVVEKAKAGTSFDELVGTYTDDEGTKDRRGSLGRFTRDKMVKAFSDAAFALPVGGVSEPIETKFGYHVIKRNQ